MAYFVVFLLKNQFSLRLKQTIWGLLSTLTPLCAPALLAGTDTAIAAMADQTNPLVEFRTSKGLIYIEFFSEEAPKNVSQIVALINGEVELIDENTQSTFKPFYYNGLIFHKVVPGFIIQAGNPNLSPVGAPKALLEDEINAGALGLGSETVLRPDGSTNPLLNIVSEEEFATNVLLPIYQDMAITDARAVLTRQDAILSRLNNMTIKELYELQGYRYLDNRFSHGNLKGTVALANTGPNTNSPEFFINLIDAPWLNGKHTVIGSVVEGFNVVETIGSIAILATGPSRLSSVIYSARRVH